MSANLTVPDKLDPETVVYITVVNLVVCCNVILCAWIYRRRHVWAPFAMRDMNSVALMVISGAIWTTSNILLFTLPTPFPWHCSLAIGLVRLPGFGLYQSVMISRLWRLYTIFIKKQPMKRSMHTYTMLGLIPTLPVALIELVYVEPIDPATGLCPGSPIRSFATNLRVAWAAVWCCIVLTLFVKLVGIRSQYSERTTMVSDVFWYFFGWVSFIGFSLYPNVSHTAGVILMSIGGAGGTQFKFWFTIGRDLKAYIHRDYQYAAAFTTLIPDEYHDLTGSLVSQLRHPPLLRLIRSHCQARHCVESVDFFVAARDRKELRSFDQMLAETLRIIQDYIRESSRLAINIQSTTRRAILEETDLMRVDLFDCALHEVMHMIEHDIKPHYVASKEYQDLLRKAADDLQELSTLQKAGLAKLAEADSQRLPDLSTVISNGSSEEAVSTPSAKRWRKVRLSTAKSPRVAAQGRGARPVNVFGEAATNSTDSAATGSDTVSSLQSKTGAED